MSSEFALEVDRRTHDRPIPTDRMHFLADRAADVSRQLPSGQRVLIDAVDNLTGNPSRLTFEGGVSGAGFGPTDQPERESYVARAVDALRELDQFGVLGMTADPAQEPELAPELQPTRTSGDRTLVTVRQEYKDREVFDSAKTVHFDGTGRLAAMSGRFVTTPVGEIPETPSVSVETAVRATVQHVVGARQRQGETVDEFGETMDLPDIDLDAFEPSVLGAFDEIRSRPTLVAAGPFGEPFKCKTLWFDLDGELRLAWEVRVTMPNGVEQYRAIVDATDERVLYCKPLHWEVGARGHVYPEDGGQDRELRPFPEEFGRIPTDVLPDDLPSEFPVDWVDGDVTAGNNVDVQVTVDGGWEYAAGTDRDGVLTFDPDDADGSDQFAVNAFYWCNLLHDYFYLLGFREEDGNFQQRNREGRGVPGDHVRTRIFPGRVWGTANMRTEVADGHGPIMQLGEVTRTGRHTALDLSVVGHEWAHGLTRRLIGALDAPQSRGLAEGCSDYVACTFMDEVVAGSWVLDDPDGMREYRYDESFPDDFGDLGTGRYTTGSEHNIGEIWCAALLEVNRNVGHELAMQLFVDACKIAPENPSMLDLRDAFVTALDDLAASGELSPVVAYAVRRGLWAAFAKFGMGPLATSNGAQLSGVAADHYETESGITAMAPLESGTGYWYVDDAGGVYRHGDAAFHGWAGGYELPAPVVDIAGTNTDDGYWLAGADGSVYPFGDATAFAPQSNRQFDGAVVAFGATPDDSGYWLATENGDVHAYGQAVSPPSVRDRVADGSIVDMEPTPDGGGYWLADASGTVLSAGTAPAVDTVTGAPSAPLSAMAALPSGRGLFLAYEDGTVVTFGGAVNLGQPQDPPYTPVVDVAVTPNGNGYWLCCADGYAYRFGNAQRYPARPVRTDTIDFTGTDITDRERRLLEETPTA
ncbi:M36 family metallopeptidase [Halorientalis pallida]|uniref:Fungalysin/Thermolysin Propeptide Motif n=1 Tax=Halorientalis pallida TaxID=2479928 RepID=A0A498KUQ6_9EURY|nr:M36 family metallopeptidase [Halorientalis pallida]RXK48620.1 hypothetical protein EAF64_13170 [Halorientalis pallida]